MKIHTICKTKTKFIFSQSLKEAPIVLETCILVYQESCAEVHVRDMSCLYFYRKFIKNYELIKSSLCKIHIVIFRVMMPSCLLRAYQKIRTTYSLQFGPTKSAL
jgi:hypothetical protein